MKRIIPLLEFVAATATCVAVSMPFMAGGADDEGSPIYGVKGGWGFAQFTDGKPDDEALHKTCFPCHQPAKGQDLVFTHYAR
jgi:hypothetical protein